MKHLRTVVLLLLTILLPIRGAVAAAMQCPGEAAMVSTAVGAGHGALNMHAGHDHAHADADADADAETDAVASDAAPSEGHASACQFCADGCCVTPLAFAPPSVARPRAASTAVFPALRVRVTVYYPDGQDRPPRST